VAIHVQDTGTGIPPETLPRIFDIFAQAERSLDRSQGGLGIGLALVRGLTEVHGGTVRVRSDGIGRGSQFTVHLPVVPAGLRDGQAEGVRKSGKGGSPIRRRILVVDDHRDSADSIGFLLKIWGHDVRIDYNGAVALTLARQHQPDVVLLDLALPELPGEEVGRLLRQESELQNTLLVAMTGYGREEDRQRTRESGFDAHLVKPIDPLRLREILQTTRGTQFAPSSGDN
jgi:CheY-like chemotaxis protein